MCAILDANVAYEIFLPDQPPAGKKFLDWLNKGKGTLVVGGRLYEELSVSGQGFREWARQALLAQKIRIEDKGAVEARTEALIAAGGYGSDDPHVLALAQVSGARLLYSNDTALQQDFKDKRLVDRPRGKVYSTLEGTEFGRDKENLLRRTVCRMPVA